MRSRAGRRCAASSTEPAPAKAGGRIELDTNSVERAIRPVALGRKNHLFAGFDGGGNRWATVCSFITTAKLKDVEPYAYFRDILERMVDGHPMSCLDDLLPRNWTPTSLNL